jgi:hypothetical protein
VGLRDVTGVFSRFFVVGFFVPSFFVVLAVAALFFDVSRSDVIYVVGFVALPTALVLVGLRDAVWEAFERYPCRSAFGRATSEYHGRVQNKWGVNVYWAWPFIKPFFNEQERELDVDGRSDVHFFINCFLGVVAIAVGLCVDAFVSPVLGAWLINVALALAAFPVAWLAYHGAASAVRPWGEFKEAAVVLHRFELYQRLGLKRPQNENEERAIAENVNDLLVRPRLGRPMGINKCAPIVAENETEIAADSGAVWEVLTAFERWPSWNPHVKWLFMRGTVTEGSEFCWKAGRARIRSTIENVAPPRCIAWTGKTFRVRMIHFCRLDQRDGKTFVRTEASYEGRVACLFRGSLQETVDRALADGLRYLKAESERRTTR